MNTDINALYIHIPFCISKCQYCDFFSITRLENKQIPDNYIDALCNEIKFRINQHKIHELKTIYIGGGTPSLLNKVQLQKILSTLPSLSSDYEFSMELNPDDISEEYLDFLRTTKINRLSVGLQSMNQNCLSFAKRRATNEQNRNALKLLKNYFPNFSVDFICGLPDETEQSFIDGLKEAISYKPKHISMYSLTIEEETPFGKLFDSGKLNYDFDQADNLWLKAKKILEQNNYPQYEVSNFAEKENQCIHNLAYWNHKSYLGCGSGGTGTIYNQSGEGFRWTNTTNIDDYITFWNTSDIKFENIPSSNEIIDLETSKFEFFMMGLRKLSGISSAEYESIFGDSLPEAFIQLAQKWKNQKLMNINIENNSTNYSLNSKGILFLNTFLESLLQAFSL